LDPVDVIGDQSVGLPVNSRRGIGRRRLDQAEDPPGILIDPIPQVANVEFVLCLQVGEMCLGDVFYRDATCHIMDIHKKRH
jgi:hypothetical protein